MSFTFPTRLAMNKGFVGPDFAGCINSGYAPAMMKSKSAAEYVGKPFVVGAESSIRFDMHAMVVAAMHGKRSAEAKSGKVRFFKTYAAAKRYFLKLTESVKASHAEAREAREKLAKTKAGTPEHLAAAMIAADHGVL